MPKSLRFPVAISATAIMMASITKMGTTAKAGYLRGKFSGDGPALVTQHQRT